MTPRPPLPPFTEETAAQKVQAAEDAWNSRDPRSCRARVHGGLANGATGTSSSRARDAIREFLRRKWARELEYRLEKELWCFHDNRISVRFEYESRDAERQWWRSHGNEHWEFDADGSDAPAGREHQRLPHRAR